MKIDSFSKKMGDDVILNSKIHPTIKESILDSANAYWKGIYELESDFVFGFIESLITKGYCDYVRKDYDDDSDEDLSEDELRDEDEEIDFESKCYKWCIKYFAKYLTELQFNIKTESGYELYVPGKSVEYLYKLIDREFGINAGELKLTIDYNILNKIQGKLYFDEE